MPTMLEPRDRAASRSQAASQVPIPRPRYVGSTAASDRSAPISSAYATIVSPSRTATELPARSYDGRCHSATRSASSISTRPTSCFSWAAISSQTA